MTKKWNGHQAYIRVMEAIFRRRDAEPVEVRIRIAKRHVKYLTIKELSTQEGVLTRALSFAFRRLI